MPDATPWLCDTPVPAGTKWAVVSATPFVSRTNCSALLSNPHWALDGGSVLVFQTAPSSVESPAE